MGRSLVDCEPPDLADLVGYFPAHEIGDKAVHRTVAGGVDDHIGGQFLAVVEPDAVRRDFLDLAIHQLDLTVDDELRGADVDVIAGAATQVLHEQPEIVVAEIEPETGFRQPCIKIGVVLADLVVDRLLQLIQDL